MASQSCVRFERARYGVSRGGCCLMTFPPLGANTSRLLCKGSLAPGVAAEIACARRICHGSSSCSLRRHAGPLANAGVADERISGLLIKRRRLLEAVGLLELGKRPLCLRAYYAVERIIVEAQIAKLDLCPPDVVLREIRSVYPILRSSRLRGHVPFRTRNGVIGVRPIIESGAADTQCQYRNRAKDQFSHGSSPVFRKFANPLSHYSERSGCKWRSTRAACEDFGTSD